MIEPLTVTQVEEMPHGYSEKGKKVVRQIQHQLKTKIQALFKADGSNTKSPQNGKKKKPKFETNIKTSDMESMEM